MRLELVPRAEHPDRSMRALASVAAFVTAFLIAGLVIGCSAIAHGGLPRLLSRSRSAIPGRSRIWLVKATPLVLIAIGLSYCFRANLWNIGAEGQYIMGAHVRRLAGAGDPWPLCGVRGCCRRCWCSASSAACSTG